ncbi:hsp70 family chaperone [Apiospora rasikravindrae]|uniref:Hsp70 family chaperone n=1 Tax=Apiospora rasikravindrae TaxID=990691 RepID=A0ABR1S543_9PEZI
MGLSDELRSFASRFKRGLHQSQNVGTDEYVDDLLVIGIDFGTTSSGVGWATAADIQSEQVNIITNWPGSDRKEGKAPTEVFYEHGKTTWGFEVGKDCDPVCWFKLLLLKEEDLGPHLKSSDFVLQAQQKLRDEGKTAVDVVADYLRCLWEHTLHVITRARGEAVVNESRFHVVITVPAIWKGYARQAMREAAEKAGILKKRLAAGETCLSFVAEPEAAALSTLSEPGHKPKKDEVYLICDGGGGTVDSITYKVRETSPLALEEAVEGSGGLCGAIFIDQALQRKVKRCLGRKWARLSNLEINELMGNSWEYGPKHQFSLDHDVSYVVTIPSAAFSSDSDRNDDRCDPPIKNGQMIFTRDHIQAIFDEAITEVDRLVDGQTAEAKRKCLQVTGIILVGGLGSSPYLYEHLRERHRDSKISILQSGGEGPRVAICRGAVLSGFLQDQAGRSQRMTEDTMPVKVVSTIARASYGIRFSFPYSPMFHRRDEVSWDDVEQDYVCKDHMLWYLEKGSNVSKMRPVSQGLYDILKPNRKGTFTVDIYQCDEEYPPPARKNKSVKHLVTITCNIATPLDEVPELPNRLGQRFRKLDFDLDMVPSGASVEFAVWAGGKKLGSSEVQIQFQ